MLSVPRPGNTTSDKLWSPEGKRDGGREGASRALHQFKVTVLTSPPVKNVKVVCHSHITFFTN